MSNVRSDRAWPIPAQPWIIAMSWHDLLFMHWPVDAASLRPLIPAALNIDTIDGAAWIGVVPFWMSGIRRRSLPALPWMSGFPELNVRTYVTAHDGKPGVWFFSLDAAHRIGVRVARRCYHLNYYDAHIDIRHHEDEIEYASRRVHRGAVPAAFSARYRALGSPANTTPGGFDHWLTARYCLYAATPAGQVLRAEIDHPPWRLQPAECDLLVNTMTSPLGIQTPRTAPLLHFSKRIDAVAWPPAPVNGP